MRPSALKREVLALWKSVEAYSWGLRHPFCMKGYSHPFHFPAAQKYPLRVTALAILFLTFGLSSFLFFSRLHSLGVTPPCSPHTKGLQWSACSGGPLGGS